MHKNENFFGHKNYYNKNFIFQNDRTSSFSPDKDFSLNVFHEMGLSRQESLSFYKSGYWSNPLLKGAVYDRFYGGALSSIDNRTRFHSDRFLGLMSDNTCRISVESIHSINELKTRISDLQKNRGGNLLFRGQTQNYTIDRPKPNPAFTIEGMGEISLLPSVWRRVLGENFAIFHKFQNLPLLTWSNILDTFDHGDINNRIKAMAENGELIFTYSEMEDCSDQVVQSFGKHQLDVSMGFGLNLADRMLTLLQHYGLYSPLLDLTSNLDVALFFATHKLNKCGNKIGYRFVGTNAQRAVIYVFNKNKTEMAPYCRDREFEALKPQRPIKQSCHVCRSDTLAMNLPLDFVTNILLLDFDILKPLTIQTNDIFPSVEKDKFLKALKEKLPLALSRELLEV